MVNELIIVLDDVEEALTVELVTGIKVVAEEKLVDDIPEEIKVTVLLNEEGVIFEIIEVVLAMLVEVELLENKAEEEIAEDITDVKVDDIVAVLEESIEFELVVELE